MAKRTITAAFMSIFLVFGVEAEMVSFLVVETGLPQEGERKQHSEHWEDSLLDVFFEAGHIVSNSPVLRLDSKPSGEIINAVTADMDEAKEGGADYFIIAQLDYAPGSQTPDEISLVLFRIVPYKKIYEKQITGKKYKSAKEETDDLKKIARGLVPHLNAQ